MILIKMFYTTRPKHTEKRISPTFSLLPLFISHPLILSRRSWNSLSSISSRPFIRADGPELFGVDPPPASLRSEEREMRSKEREGGAEIGGGAEIEGVSSLDFCSLTISSANHEVKKNIQNVEQIQCTMYTCIQYMLWSRYQWVSD